MRHKIPALSMGIIFAAALMFALPTSLWPGWLAAMGGPAIAGDAKPAKDDKAAKGEKDKKDTKAGKGGKGGKPEEPAKPEKSKMEHTDGYVHEWVPFPAFSAMALPGGSKFEFKPERGQVSVIVMVATWCAPCVKMMPEILRLEARTARLPVKFVHVFTHDTRQDATGFMGEYGMKSGVLANHEVLAAFKNPDLPAIFVADRNTWMLMRYIKATPADLAEVEESIKYLTAI
jgi:thiol-disulfide isomerase/thioredoxin